MIYGRLDVFWPDGKFESYLIDNDTTTVGRSSGSTIVLDTDTISRYHFSLAATQGGLLEISDMDSANGTYVDGVKLDNNDQRVLQGGEEIQIGHLRIIFHRIDEHPTVPMAALEEETQRFIREDLEFRVECYGPDIAVPPGAHTSVELNITNESDEARRFIVKVAGLPAGWARINRPELVVEPDVTAPVLINIKPFIHSDSTPGDYQMQVTVALKDDPEAKIEAEIPVQILPYIGLGMALANTRVSSYEPFRLHLHNQGTIGMPLNIMGRSPDNMLRFVLPQSQLILAPGQHLVATGDVLPLHRRWLGPTIERSFHLMVRSRDEASFLAVVPGLYRDKAILPRWALFGVGLLAMVAALLFVLILVGLSGDPEPPEVLAFEVEQAAVTQGEPLILTWEVANANTVNITINGEQVATNIPAADGRIEIDSSAYEGNLNLVLEAVEDDRTAISSLSVLVERPLIIETFEVEPRALARNVVQTLTGRWTVEGAVETRVEGLQELGPVSVETSFGPEGSFQVSGLPVRPFSVILVATGEDGNTVTRSIDIALFDPVCTTTVENLNLFSAPDESSNVISTLRLGQAIVVDARSADANWLRTSREGISAWGSVSGLRCEDSFDQANLYVDPSTISTPEATPQVTPPGPEVTPEATP